MIQCYNPIFTDSNGEPNWILFFKANSAVLALNPEKQIVTQHESHKIGLQKKRACKWWTFE